MKKLLLLSLMMLCMAGTAVAQEQIPLILFDGVILDDSGQPIERAQVQFWQTDPNGYYDHPAELNTHLRDLSFQFYGTATTDDDGSFSFRTYRPGIYEPRPTHIHFKVWLNGTELLTSQLYFADENPNQPASLILDLVEVTDENGEPAMSTSKTIVVNMDGNGSQALTPSQQEGPFYPVVDFFGYDNDLTTLDPTAVQTTSVTATTSNLLLLMTVTLIMTVGLHHHGQKI